MSETSEMCDSVKTERDSETTDVESATGASGGTDSDPTDPQSSGEKLPEESSYSVSIEFKVPTLTVKTTAITQSNLGNKESSKEKSSSDEGLNQPDISNECKKFQSKLSPAELLKHSETPLPYKEPIWGGLCTVKYKFEVIKNGTIVTNIDLTKKSFYVFGRLPTCDVPMEHPSLSRYHAVVQHCKQKNEKHDIGWYLYDLGSTHGTWLNKQKIQPRIYHRLKVGHVVKFGGSTRLHILQARIVLYFNYVNKGKAKWCIPIQAHVHIHTHPSLDFLKYLYF